MSFFLVLREVPEVPTGLNENVWKTGRIGYWKKLTIGSASNSVSRPDSIVNLVQRILSGKKRMPVTAMGCGPLSENRGSHICFTGCAGADNLPSGVPVYFVARLRREFSARVNSPPHITSEVAPMIVSQSRPERGTVRKTFPPQVTMMN